MFEFIAGIFGYILDFIYNFVNNYGFSIIIFTIIIKLLMLPLTIKQQRTMIKSAKLQEKMKVLQFKYKNDPEKLNQAMMNMYKEEKMSPLSGCLSTIVQFILLISIFFMVSSPLTYMDRIPKETIDKCISQLQENNSPISGAYPQIDLIREADWLRQNNPDDENIQKIGINMNFLGLDLSKIPQQNMTDYTVYIIPVLYIISTFISMKLTTAMQNKTKKKKEEVIDITESNDKEKGVTKVEEEGTLDTMAQTNKMMMWMMPILSVSIAFVAPLGLALYWLVNNILMICERLVLNKVIKTEEE